MRRLKCYTCRFDILSKKILGLHIRIPETDEPKRCLVNRKSFALGSHMKNTNENECWRETTQMSVMSEIICSRQSSETTRENPQWGETVQMSDMSEIIYSRW